MISLSHIPGGWHGKKQAYSNYILSAGGRSRVASISFCFSSDLLNRLCRKSAFIISSIRGNLHANYKFDYGRSGSLLALIHMQILKGFDRVTVLSSAMAAQLARYLGRLPKVIGNFIDETSVEPYRKIMMRRQGLKIAFVGSLSERKQPKLALEALKYLGPSAHLDLIGAGPLQKEVERMLIIHNLGTQVKLHGHLTDPLHHVSEADLFLLPSFSEGISRASLEALFLGVPCVLRNIDGNKELIQHGYNGALFLNDEEIPLAIREAQNNISTPYGQPRKNLLLETFRQKHGVSKFLELIKN